MIKKLAISVVVILSQVSLSCFSQNLTPILLDEAWDEWTDITDIANVGTTGNATIKAINTDDHLFIYLETTDVLSIQNDTRIILYLDTDNNAGTGISVNGIGAEIKVDFGIRTVTTNFNDSESTLGFRDIELAVMPTVWSDKFEIAIQRDKQVGGNAVFTSDEIKIVVEDQGSQSYSPSASGGASYTFGDFAFDDLSAYTIAKPDAGHLRMISYNVLRDNIFEDNVKDNFKRLLQATDPDIVGFQEIYNHSGEDVAALMEEFLPSAQGEAWYGSKVHDNIVASRFPIKSTYEANNAGNGAFLINMRPTYEADLLLINAHTPCCDNDAGRTSEIDAMMAFVRDAKSGSGDLKLDEGTPIVIMGDMNLVGNPQQILTLKNGDIQDEETWGADFTADWNGEEFKDVLPRVTGLPMTFTHWSPAGSGRYSSGRLDAIMYSGSGLTLHNGYVLYTTSMSDTELTNNALQTEDSEAASDHLPMIADFEVTAQIEKDLGMLDLRENDQDGVPVLIGETITVGGVVTADDEFGNQHYIQDNDAGVTIFGNDFASLFALGDSIEIKSVVGHYNGNTQLTFDQAITTVNVLKQVDIPAPKIVNIADVLEQDWNGFELLEGLLIKLVGVEFVENGTFTGGTNYTIVDGVNSLTLRIDSDTDLVGATIPDEKIDVIGVITQFDNSAPYSEGYQIMPRTKGDLIEALDGMAAVRANDSEGRPALNGVTATVSGVVSATQFGGNGPIYMQDESTGVALYGADLINGLNPGDSITVTTEVGFYNGLTELMYAAGITNVTTHKTADIPAATVVTISDVLNQNWAVSEPYEALLIQFDNVQFQETGTFSGNSNYTISDGTNSLNIRIDGDTDIAGLEVPTTSGNIIGVLSQFDNTSPFSEGYQLFPRNRNDFDFESEVVASVNDDPQLDLYPNPSNGQLKIEWKEGVAPTSILIFDINGKLKVLAKVGTGERSISISTDHLTSGIYNCQIQLKDRTINRKLIVD